MTDLPDRRHPSQARLLRLMLDAATESAFVFLDEQGRIMEWSRGAENLFSFSADEALGQDFTRIFVERDRERGIAELEMAIARADAISEDDRWHVRKDGSRFWATGSITALRDDDGTLIGFVKVLRDRTNLREQIELLTRQLDAARGGEDAREIVLAKVSHELRNLLASLTHGLQLIGAPQADPARRNMLTKIMQEQIDVARRLTEDLLDVERVKEGKVSLQRAPMVIQEVLIKAIDALRPRVKTKQLELELFEPSAPLCVHGDATRLYQVFVNLLDNAIKYTPPGGRIWTKVTVEDPDAVVHIEDTGVGIPPDMLQRIFDLFTQVDSDVSKKGLGIGLALVHELVLMHGGSVQARSEGVGKGSVFTVRLPLYSSD